MSTGTVTVTWTRTTRRTRSPPPDATCERCSTARTATSSTPSTATTTRARTSPTCSPARAPTARVSKACRTPRSRAAATAAPRRHRLSCDQLSEVTHPRAYATLPAWAMAGGRAAQPIDARLLDDALWLLRTYRLRVTAAREGGHETHGDGTALDLVPAEPVDQAAWDRSAGALARALGWTPACGRSGTRPVCPLVPAMQFVGYEGYPGHGSPATCAGSCAAHLHISWASPCYGTSAPSAPCGSVQHVRPGVCTPRRFPLRRHGRNAARPTGRSALTQHPARRVTGTRRQVHCVPDVRELYPH